MPKQTYRLAPLWTKGNGTTVLARPVVRVIGAGVAGLSVAHELMERGFNVQVVEKAVADPVGDGLGFQLHAVAVGGIAKTQWVKVDTHLGSDVAAPVSGPAAGHDGYWASEGGAVAVSSRVVTGDVAAMRFDDLAGEEDRKHGEPTFARQAKVPSSPNEEIVAGDHGYRFFPAFYRNLFDTMRRTPLLEPQESLQGEATLKGTRFTAYDQLHPVENLTFGLGAADQGKRPFKVARNGLRSLAEVKRFVDFVLRRMKITPTDAVLYQYRLLKWLTACDARREAWSEPLLARDTDGKVSGLAQSGTWRDFMKASPEDGEGWFSEAFSQFLFSSAQALAAMSDAEVDAATYGTVAVQLLLDQVDDNGFVDGALNGPTTSAWFVYWKRFLQARGVRFFRGELTALTPEDDTLNATYGHQESDPAAGRTVEITTPVYDDPSDPVPGWELGFDHFDRPADLSDEDKEAYALTPDFHVLATPLDETWRLLDRANEAKEGAWTHRKRGVLQELWDWRMALSEDKVKDEGSALQQVHNRAPLDGLDFRYAYEDAATVFSNREVSEVAFNPFRTICGVQYFYECDLRIADGHFYLPMSEWGLSGLSQAQFWTGGRNYGVVSLDVGDMHKAVPHAGESVTAWTATPEAFVEIVEQQMLEGLQLSSVSDEDVQGRRVLPDYFHVHVDRYLERGDEGTIQRNNAPYLINLPGDFARRPGTIVETKQGEHATRLPRRHIHFTPSYDGWFVAGPHTKTFTRLTSMEAANESARHVVSNLLRVHEQRAKKNATLPKTMGIAPPIWDPTRNEVDDLEWLRVVDHKLFHGKDGAKGRPAPHMFDILGLDERVQELVDASANASDEVRLSEAFEDLLTDSFRGWPRPSSTALSGLGKGVADKLQELFGRR